MEISLSEELKVFHALAQEVKEQFRLDIDSDHGIAHWERVRRIGFYLATTTNANLRVVNLFSVLHDSQRNDEYNDSEHGARAVDYVTALYNKNLLPISGDQLKTLVYACRHHSDRNAKSDDVTIQTCWDADRLDLYRVGEIPDPKYLYTAVAKKQKTINFAIKLSNSYTTF